MRRVWALLLALVLTLGLVMVIGCSDSTESEPKTEGDPMDPDFQEFLDDVGDGTQFNQILLEAMFVAIDSVFNHPDYPVTAVSPKGEFETKALAEPDEVTITYHEQSEYWYAELSGTEIDELSSDTIFYAITDSIQFRHSGAPVQWPDPELLTEVRHGTSMNMWDAFGTDTGYVTQNVTVAGEIVQMGLVTINGSGTVSLEASETDGETSCDFGMQITTVFNNITADLTALQTDEGCPSDGSMSNSVYYNLSCTGPDGNVTVNDYWSVSATYSDGLEHLVVENSTTRWEVDEECGTGPIQVF